MDRKRELKRPETLMKILKKRSQPNLRLSRPA